MEYNEKLEAQAKKLIEENYIYDNGCFFKVDNEAEAKALREQIAQRKRKLNT
jgi:hypothetical protein